MGPLYEGCDRAGVYIPLTFVSVGVVLLLLAALGAGAGFAGGALVLVVAWARRHGAVRSDRSPAGGRRSDDAPPDVAGPARAAVALALAVVLAAVAVPVGVAATGFRFLAPLYGVPALSGVAVGALTVYAVAVVPVPEDG